MRMLGASCANSGIIQEVFEWCVENSLEEVGGSMLLSRQE